MSELAEFLLARITEDETEIEHGVDIYARSIAKASGRDVAEVGADLRKTAKHQRDLAECEAKRRIVERFADVLLAGFDSCGDGQATLGYLAGPYAGHPDFRKEWRP